MNKPTKEELKSWDKLLQEEGLGMERGHNSTRLNYGFEVGQGLVSHTLDDVRIYTTQKRKAHTRLERTCVICRGTFAARADAKCCGARCRKRLERCHTKSTT